MLNSRYAVPLRVVSLGASLLLVVLSACGGSVSGNARFDTTRTQDGGTSGDSVNADAFEATVESATTSFYTVSTYNSVSVYLSDATAPEDDDARVRYRKLDDRLWRPALPLWYDARDKQYRGSLVGLDEGATYVVEVTLDDGTKRAIEATTWTEDVPVAKVVTLPESSSAMLTITESGTADGYVGYQPANGRDAVIDVAKDGPGVRFEDDEVRRKPPLGRLLVLEEAPRHHGAAQQAPSPNVGFEQLG